MIRKICLFLFFSASLLVQGQYTTVINSNRPGYSESPYSVGSGIYQLESTLFYRKVPVSETFSNPRSLGLDLLFRTSFLSENLEFNFHTALANERIAFKNIFESSYTHTGLQRFTLAAKYFVFAPKYKDKSKEIRSWKARHSFDWRRWIPHVGIYVGGNFGPLVTEFNDKGGITPRVGLLLQNEFSNKLNVITNVFYDNIGAESKEISCIVTGTYNFNDYWSGFAEIQTIFAPYEKKTNIGGGAAYLFSENLQFNACIRANLENSTMGVTAGVGVSYRINRHVDEYVELDEFGNRIEDDKPVKYDENRSFFGKIFSKLGKIFKKKRKSDTTVDPEFATDSTQVRTERPTRKREKSLIEEIEKDDTKLKKKATKAEEKAIRKAAKEKEKAARKAVKDAEKERKRAEKEAEKERKRLEKEAEKERKRLEKQLEDERKRHEEEAEEERKRIEKEAKEKEKERLKLEKEIKELEKEIEEEEEEQKKDDD